MTTGEYFKAMARMNAFWTNVPRAYVMKDGSDDPHDILDLPTDDEKQAYVVAACGMAAPSTCDVLIAQQEGALGDESDCEPGTLLVGPAEEKPTQGNPKTRKKLTAEQHRAKNKRYKANKRAREEAWRLQAQKNW
jgi:hypothetical protein